MPTVTRRGPSHLPRRRPTVTSLRRRLTDSVTRRREAPILNRRRQSRSLRNRSDLEHPDRHIQPVDLPNPKC